MPSPTFISGLLYPRMKTSRAGEHLQFINDEWARFQADNPYTVTEKDDPEKCTATDFLDSRVSVITLPA